LILLHMKSAYCLILFNFFFPNVKMETRCTHLDIHDKCMKQHRSRGKYNFTKYTIFFQFAVSRHHVYFKDFFFLLSYNLTCVKGK
jgi:hypothetical protein